MLWEISHRAELRSRLIADRHYNRQKIGSPQFVPPGRCLVLYAGSPPNQAFWITSYPFAEYVKHQWGGAWVCSAFRNENAGIASELIRDALIASRDKFGKPPPLGMVTFLDTKKVKPIKVRGKNTWGYTWLKAGFKHVGWTKGGLMALQILPEDMPFAQKPIALSFEPATPLSSNLHKKETIKMNITFTLDTSDPKLQQILSVLGANAMLATTVLSPVKVAESTSMSGGGSGGNGGPSYGGGGGGQPDKAAFVEQAHPAQDAVMPAFNPAPAPIVTETVQAPAMPDAPPTGRQGRKPYTPEQKAAIDAEKEVAKSMKMGYREWVTAGKPQPASAVAAASVHPAQVAAATAPPPVASLPGVPAQPSPPIVVPANNATDLKAHLGRKFDQVNSGPHAGKPFQIMTQIIPTCYDNQALPEPAAHQLLAALYQLDPTPA